MNPDLMSKFLPIVTRAYTVLSAYILDLLHGVGQAFSCCCSVCFLYFLCEFFFRGGEGGGEEGGRGTITFKRAGTCISLRLDTPDPNLSKCPASSQVQGAIKLGN